MTLEEMDFLSKNIDTSELYGCDCSISNTFIYQDRYKITSFVKENIFFRFYDTTPNHTGWAFPIPLKTAQKDYLKTAMAEIIKSGKLRFCYCSLNQKKLIDQCIEEFFPQYSVQWESFRGDSDYLYLQKNLAELPGKEYQKKRNHISKFNRTFENRWTIKTFPEDAIQNDMLAVETQWFTENNGSTNPDLQSEYKIIKNTIDNAEALNITGAVLYVDQKPSAMCLAAKISDQTLDVLFEKATESTADFGAYAAINQLFSKHCSSYTYLNREEDLGIEGLRKAKLSWKPEIILDKFYGNLVKK